jgi:hypothetical protein
MGLGHAERAFLHRPGELITLNAPQVESMQVRQMNNAVDAVLDRLGIYRPGGDVSGHEALDLLLQHAEIIARARSMATAQEKHPMLYWKLRHTQCNRSHRMMVLGATDRLSCIVSLSKFYSSGDPLFLGHSPSPAFSTNESVSSTDWLRGYIPSNKVPSV